MVGKITTQGDIAIKSNVARSLFSVDGSGVKVGIISTSFNAQSSLNADIKNGDLPGKDNPLGYDQPVNILADTAVCRFKRDSSSSERTNCVNAED